MNDMEEMSEYEKKCEQYKKVNEQYLEWFRQDLEEKGLKPKTIKNHIENMEYVHITYKKKPLQE